MGYKSKWSWVNEETARDYYLENYEGLSRGELQKDKKDRGFYKALQNRGLLDILPESKRRDWSFLNEETARAHYLKNFEGMSRKEVGEKDGGFYAALRDRELVDIVFRPFYNMEEFQEHLEESGLLEDLFNEDIMVKDVNKFSEIVKEYCEYNCQTIESLEDELGMRSLRAKLNPKGRSKLHPEEIEKVQKYMQNPENDRWKEYSLESEL